MSLGFFFRYSVRLPTFKSRCAISATLLIFALGFTCPLLALNSSDNEKSDDETIHALLQRIDKLEARVAQLESASGSAANTPAPPAAQQSVVQSSEPTPPAEGETPMSERMDVSKTLLKMRGFGDVSFHGDTRAGTRSSFTLGQLNLFITSDISDKFKFLSEIVFEGGPDTIFGVRRGADNSFGIDVERFLLQYSHNDHFNLVAGRYHTAIGYYNTAYHHSTWFQTTQGRPFLFEFEDRGGILPVHNVGVSASGSIPSGPLGLHYVAEVGNGRRSRSPLDEEQVQNVVDENTHKAFNLAVLSRPRAFSGLQLGFSVYRDLLTPANSPAVGETILATHAVVVRSTFEWLNEVLVIRHAPAGSQHTFQTPGFYTQVSKQFGSYRPYFRYQYVNASGSEPIFPDVGRIEGPSVGVRYDASDFVALKLQYDYTQRRREPAENSLGLQVGFTF